MRKNNMLHFARKQKRQQVSHGIKKNIGNHLTSILLLFSCCTLHNTPLKALGKQSKNFIFHATLSASFFRLGDEKLQIYFNFKKNI